MALVVFGSRLSPFVEKVTRALALKELPYELVAPRRPGDFKKWSPVTGKMPVLVVDGEHVYDSTFILRRLDALRPEPPLYAADPTTAARQRQLEDWADESLYWYLMALRWSVRNEAASVRQILHDIRAPSLVAPLLGRMLRRQIGGSCRAQGLGRLPHDVLEMELSRLLDDLVLILGVEPFFFAPSPSAADLAVHGMITGGLSGPTPEVQRMLEARPALGAWRERVIQATGG